MKNITVATKKNIGHYPILVESCARHNIELIVLGLGMPWRGFTMRFDLWLEYLNTLNDSEVVMINDAYDVIVLEHAATILKKFHEMKKPVIFGHQDGIYERMTNQKTTLCFGNMIGFVKHLKIILYKLIQNKKLWKQFNHDDQLILNHLYRKDETLKSIVGLDTKQNIFFVASDMNRLNINYWLNGSIQGLKMRNDKLYNAKGKSISVLHLPANLHADLYLDYVGYDISKINIVFEHYRIGQFFTKYLNYVIFVILLCFMINWIGTNTKKI